jgi:phosphate transport system substrate-binding protein
MMKRSILLGLLAFAVGGQAMAADIHGAGSSFAAPLYEAWIFGSHNTERIDYKAVGSGEGIKQVTAKTVDFGASDAPLTAAELESKGLLQFPSAAAALVPVVNIPGIYAGQLKLSGDVLAGIYSGAITKWSDSRIADLNPLLKLPSKSIIVLHREDESGSTYVFTNYLSKISADWKSSVGQGLTVKWPTGVAVKGGKALAEAVKSKEGAIGYIEYSSSVNSHLVYASLKNAEGQFVKPLPENIEAALVSAQWNGATGFSDASATNAPGPKSWPLTTATFVLVPKVVKSAGNTQQVLRMMDWGFRYGHVTGGGLGFVAVPKTVVEQVHTNWQSLHDALGLPVYGK